MMNLWFRGTVLWLVIVLAATTMIWAASIEADQAQYFYDELGRLVGVVDGQGNIASYQYDKVGNLLSIVRGTVTAPVITGVSPDMVDAGTSIPVRITGHGFFFPFIQTSVTTSNPEIRILNLTVADSEITGTLFSPNPTAFGSTTLTISAPGGSTSTTLTVRRPTPTIGRLNPAGGTAGISVAIEGQGFGTKPGSNRVAFSGPGGSRLLAEVFSDSNTSVTVRAPVGLVTGPVTVDVGALTSNGVIFDNTGASVLRVLPFDGQSDVAPNTRITLVFDERIDPASVTNGTFFVTGPGGPVTGTVSVPTDQLSATFIAAQPLAVNTPYSITSTTGIRDLFGNALVNSGTTTFSTGSALDSTGPAVITVSPAEGAQGVPTNAVMRITFPEALFIGSVTSQTVTLSTGGVQVPVQLALEQDNSVLRIQLVSPPQLETNTTYTVIVTTGVTDQAGNPLAAAFSSSFTTGAGPDTTPPAVVSVTPPDRATNVPLTTSIEVTFSEAINSLTVNANTFALTGGGVVGNIPGSFSFSADRRTVTFTPNAPLFLAQTFFVSLSDIEDGAGNKLAPRVTSFDTNTPETQNLPTGATVLVSPGGLFANGQTVARVRIVGINRNGALLPDGTLVGVTVEPVFALESLGGTILVGTPSTADPRFKLFSTQGGSVTLFYQSPNLVDIRLRRESFVQVVSVDAAGTPVNLIGLGDVGLFTSDFVDILTANPVELLANGNSFSEISLLVVAGNLAAPAGVRIGLRTPSVGGTINGGTAGADPTLKIFSTMTGGLVEFTYTAPAFAPGQTGTAVLDVVAVDQAGNAVGLLKRVQISLSGSSGFTAPLPVVLAMSPAQSQTDVATNAPVMAQFSQSLDPSTVNAATFSVSIGGSPLAGSFALSASEKGPDTVVTFTPTSALAPNSVVEVAITSGIQSAARNPLPFVFATFVTGSAVDTTVPSVMRVNPANALSGVPINSVVAVEFSEPVSAVTVNTTTVRLSLGGVPISGRLRMDNGVRGPNTLAIVTPDQLLPPDATYTVSLTTGITDTAGNPLAAAFSSSFTTASGPLALDQIRPSVVSASPFNNQENVPLNTKIKLQFDEPLSPLAGSVSLFSFLLDTLFQVSFELAPDGMSLTITPTQPLQPFADYQVLLFGFTDIAGNELELNVTQFFTGATSDTASPQVLTVSPADGISGVPLNAPVALRFSEPLDRSSVTGQTVVVGTGDTRISGALTVEPTSLFEPNNIVVRWRPANGALLAPTTSHTVTVTAGVTDLAGNPLAAPFVSSFTTGTATDTTAPTGTTLNPPDGATAVPRGSVIEMALSEALNSATIDGEHTLGLFGGDVDGAIPGTLVLSADRRTMTFTPSFPLFANQTYFLSLEGIEDVAGNKLVFTPTSFGTAVAAGTDLSALPNAATLPCCAFFLPANGMSTLVVTISNINRDGVVVPDGTLVAVTAEPAFRLQSQGGQILGGTPSAADPRFRLFPTVGGSVTVTYQAANLPNLISSEEILEKLGIIQAASVDAAGTPVSLIGATEILLTRP